MKANGDATIRVVAVKLNGEEMPSWLPKDAAAATIEVPAAWCRGNGANLVLPGAALLGAVFGVGQVGQVPNLVWARPERKAAKP